jgi:galactokinase
MNDELGTDRPSLLFILHTSSFPFHPFIFFTLVIMKLRKFFAPGRVNLIGEHTDYNEGFVLPVAIDTGTFVSGVGRDDRTVRVYSHNFDETREFSLDNQAQPQRGIWLDYIEGIAHILEAQGFRLSGAELEIESTVPIGGGLSSSTALDISFALALLGLAGLEMDKRALALASQQSNHLYVGTRGGLMDQLTILFGRAGHALLIDCRSLDIQPIPMDTRDIAIVICNSNVKHNLVLSEYNLRRAECEQGVELLKSYLPQISALRDVSVSEFTNLQDELPEPVRRRCRHVVSENARCLAAAEALSRDDFHALGELMYASHQSLRDDYEVSCRELDALVDSASKIDGVIGARMTGGGFGGCTVNLVRRDALEAFQRFIESNYRATTGIAASIYIAEVSEGAREL